MYHLRGLSGKTGQPTKPSILLSHQILMAATAVVEHLMMISIHFGGLSLPGGGSTLVTHILLSQLFSSEEATVRCILIIT